MTHTAKAPPQIRTWPGAEVLRWAERRSGWVLAAMTALFVVTLFAGLTLKLAGWAQGYDQIDYQQSIWNTTQGRFLAISHYRHTDHLWGMDFIPAILLIVPFYALFPSALTLNFIQALLMGLGALPTYGAARARLDSRLAGLGFAAVYLLYPSTWFATMSAPWQPRTLAVPALIGAFYFLQKAGERRAWIGWSLCLLAALITRTDASLCVIGFGLLAAVWRRGWHWALPPIVVGAAWFYLSTSLIVPAFYRTDYLPQAIESSGDACADYSKNWPGKSPQLAYYCHLGGSTGEILLTIVTQPLKVAQIVVTPPKMTYLLLMLLPLLLLPLLAPDAALPALPILAMNLLTNRSFQYTVREQYQTLVIPGLIIAAIVGAARLWTWSTEHRTQNIEARDTQASEWTRGRLPAIVHQLSSFIIRHSSFIIGLLVAWTFLLNLIYRNPVVTTLRYRETPERIAAMEQLAAMVPPDAPLAASSFLAPNMMPREYIYYFPNSPSFPPLERADYLFIDTRASALEMPEGRAALADVRGSGRWELLAEQEDLLLLRRVR